MRKIRFVDEKMDTYYRCIKLLQNKRFWTRKLLANDSKILLYESEADDAIVFAVREARHIYHFLLSKDGSIRESYPFRVFLGFAYSTNEDVNFALKFCKGECFVGLQTIKKIPEKVGDQVVIAYDVNTSTKTVYDNLFDFDGHQETVYEGTDYYYIRCVGINHDNNRKLYTFLYNDKTSKKTFEIIE